MAKLQQIWNRLKSRVAACWKAMAGDFDYSSDYFFGLDFFMILAGVRFNTGSVRKRRLWNVYRIAILLPFVIVGWNLASSVIHREKLGVILNIVEIMIAGIMCFTVTSIISWNYEPMMQVRRYINRRHFGRDRDSAFLIRSQSFYRTRRITIIFGLCEICSLLSFFAIDISKITFLKMPFDVRDQNPMLQNLCEMLVKCLFVGPMGMTLLTFLAAYIVLTGMRTELEVIAESFGRIFAQADKRTQMKVESEPGSSEQHEARIKYYFSKYALEEFSECIQLHEQFLQQLNVIKPLNNATFLTVYYSTTVSIACGVFYLLYVKTFSVYALLILYCIGVLFIGCAVFTWLVTKLTETHESIGEQVYDLDWPTKLEFIPQLAEEYRSMRMTILTVMIQSQQPLRLNCFGFFEFTQEKFTELVDMTYSLVSFFRNFV